MDTFDNINSPYTLYFNIGLFVLHNPAQRPVVMERLSHLLSEYKLSLDAGELLDELVSSARQVENGMNLVNIPGMTKRAAFDSNLLDTLRDRGHGHGRDHGRDHGRHGMLAPIGPRSATSPNVFAGVRQGGRLSVLAQLESRINDIESYLAGWSVDRN
jgi:hypothetical protein